MSFAAAPRLAAGVVICGLALLTYFQFPGHTWLQQDTQIYEPILQHLRDPGALDRDLVVQYPHVSYTLYDEITLGLKRLTGADFQHVLGAEQITCRAFGIWGIYLMATAAGLDLWAALLAASIFSLGAMIAGPSVLTFEYEPTPRAFAIPLVFCAMGLVSRKRYTAAGIAAAAAFIIHPPSTIPFWIALGFVAWRAKPAWIALLCAVAGILVAAHVQPGLREQQEFFTRLTPEQEQVQRMRTAYNWISIWWRGLLPQYITLYGLAMLAYTRVKTYLSPELRVLSIVLPAMGMLSMPLSYLLLEQLKWSLVPQLQPMRVLLFVTVFAVLLASVAAIKATHVLESAAWFVLVFYIPMRAQLFDPTTLRMVLAAVGLAAFAVTTLRWPRPEKAAGESGVPAGPATKAVPVLSLVGQAVSPASTVRIFAGLLAFFVLPGIGGVSNYPNLHTPEIADLARWAHDNTPRAAMFLFPDAGHSLYPGLFRAKASRAVYVDWKSGGQVNYLKDFAGEWRTRWNAVNREGYGASAIPFYRSLGIDYLVLQRDHPLDGPGTGNLEPGYLKPIYRNSQYAVYRITE
jgi:hypothetical protein